MKVLRHILLLFGIVLGCLVPNEVGAQDLILTIQGDSMNVKIQLETEQFIYYRSKESRKKDLVISRKEISELVYGFYSSKNNGKAKYVYRDPSEFKRAQVWASAGFSYMLTSNEATDEVLIEYYDELNVGDVISSFSGGVNVFFTDVFGLGMVFEQSEFANRLDGLVEYTTRAGNSYIGTLADDIRLQHIGISCVVRLSLNRSPSAFQLTGGLGYTTYRNDGEFLTGLKMHAESLGSNLTAEYQVALGEGLYVPIKVGVRTTIFSNPRLSPADDMPDDVIDDLELFYDDPINTISGARLEVSLGLLFAF